VEEDEDHTFQHAVGTLIEDMGKLGIITRVLASGALKTKVSAIKWRNNYEITYNDGDIQIIAEKTFNRLVKGGSIKVLSS
tara:strand:+ start:259 stop:498 length:240 start_codon:yes stop_codon:yes gene_type:complete